MADKTILYGDPTLDGKIDYADLGLAVAANINASTGSPVYDPTGAAERCLQLYYTAHIWQNIADIGWYLAGWERHYDGDGQGNYVGKIDIYNTGM